MNLNIPGLCAVCKCWDTSRICRTCIVRFAPAGNRCLRCAVRVPEGIPTCAPCLLDPPEFDAAVAAVDYRYPWSTLVAKFKFNEALDLSGALAGLLRDAQRNAQLTRSLPMPDIIAPVPLSKERLRARGFNQAWELARRVGKALKLRADPGLLLRIIDTGHQSGGSRAERRLNVQGAFAVEPRRLAGLRGRSIALVDDVMTTGATMKELARVARQAGASHVQVWALARTPPSDA